VTHSELLSILRRVDPAGPGPDAPLFSEGDLSKLAAIPSSEEDLLNLLRNSNSDSNIRFLAAETLVEGPWNSWRNDSATRRLVADALTNAMADDQLHNRWGLPDSFVGPFGRRLLSLGAEADAALQNLIADERYLHIVGSEAATLNSQAGFRVSDLASWLIANSRDVPWHRGHVP
jgi:hypothetical protein